MSLIYAVSASSAELNVRYKLKNYSLDYDVSLISLKSSQLNLTIHKEDCNVSIIEKFNSQVREMIKRSIKLKNPGTDTLEVSASNKFYVSDRSPSGKFFRLIPDEVKRLKIESVLSCKK